MVSGLNFLSDRDWTGAHETVVSFVQDLDLSAAYSKLGGLAGLKNSSGSAIFSVSPGVDLVNSGNITRRTPEVRPANVPYVVIPEA